MSCAQWRTHISFNETGDVVYQSLLYTHSPFVDKNANYFPKRAIFGQVYLMGIQKQDSSSFVNYPTYVRVLSLTKIHMYMTKLQIPHNS